MKRMTIFTAPKPFEDAHIRTIQRNAIRSWQQMGEGVDIFLVGDEAGAAEAARELGVQHLTQVKRNAQHTPLVSSIFEVVRAASDAPFLAYVNADILLLPETLQVVEQVGRQAGDFVLVGQRYDMEIRGRIDFSGDWVGELSDAVRKRGRLHPPGGSDYFIFARHLYRELPDFAIGRAGWDNWMIYHAVEQEWKAADASATLRVIHQNHDYGHLPEGEAHYRAAESEENVKIAGGMRHFYTLLDLKYELREGRIQAARPNLPRLLRWAERRLQPDERAGSGWRWALLRRVRRWRRTLLGAEES